MTTDNKKEDETSPLNNQPYNPVADQGDLDVDSHMAKNDPFADTDPFQFDSDFSNDDFDKNFDDGSAHHVAQSKSQLNWFNIGIVGFAIAAIGGASYLFLPDMLGLNRSNNASMAQLQPPQALVENALDTPQQIPSGNDKIDLAKQALNNDQSQPSSADISQEGLLTNPDLVNQIAQTDTPPQPIEDSYNADVVESLNKMAPTETPSESTVQPQDSTAQMPFVPSSPSPAIAGDTLSDPMSTATQPLPQPSDSPDLKQYDDIAVETLDDLMPKPSTNTPATALTETPSVPSAPVTESAAPVTAKTDAPLQTAEDTAVPTTTKTAVEETPAPAAPVTATPAPAAIAEVKADKELSNQVTTLTSRMDALNDRMDQLVTMMESLQNRPAPQAASVSASSADAETIRSLEKTVSKLEARLNNVAESAARTKTVTASATPASAPAPSVAQKKPAPAPEASAYGKPDIIMEPASKTAQTATPAAPTRPTIVMADAPKQPSLPPVIEKQAKPAIPSIQWELRGASPGQAYIAQKGTGTVREVREGDIIDGLGRITSIAVEKNRWVVHGTTSSVTQ